MSSGEFGLDRRAALIGSLALGAGVAPAFGNVPAGSVVAVSGAAVAVLNAAERALAQDGQVFIGDRIATREGARASIKLGRATDLRLGERARVTIDRYIVDAGGTITLGEGAAFVDKDPAASRERLNIRSSYGLIAVRGTRFFAGPSAGVFGVFVERGRVAVGAAGREVIVDSGQGTDIAEPGAAPTPPKAWGQRRIGLALGLVY